jgi:PII-like signaling protein/predicted transcriptional regulator
MMAFTAMERSAKRMRIYIGDSDLWRGKPLYAVLLEQLKREGLAGATVFRGTAGFGAHSRIHTAAILDLSMDLPIVIEVIDSPEKIQQALESISPMVREGLITLEPVEVIAYTHRDLHPLPADRLVREVMTQAPVSAPAGQALVETWQTMLKQNIKALPVIDQNHHVVGLLTHDDLLERAGLTARLAVALRLDEETLDQEMGILRRSGLRVQDIMSQPPITIQADQPLGLAAERLVKHSITRLPVIDEHGALVGMLSRLDVLRQVLDRPETEPPQPAARTAGRLAGEIMTSAVPQVTENAGLAQVIASFVASGEHRVLVVNAAGQPVGLISDSDVIGRIQPAHRRGVLGALRGLVSPPALAITAGELMSPGAETISAGTSVIEAIHRMVTSQRKWLVVVDAAGKPTGLLDREIVLESLVR